jgi:hypothetical protein
MPRKIVTPAERIDQMIAAYEKLNREAHDLLDLAVAEYIARSPGIPAGVVKQLRYTNRAGTTIDIPAALRILREKFIV